MISFIKYIVLSFIYALVLMLIFIIDVKNEAGVLIFFLVWFIAVKLHQG